MFDKEIEAIAKCTELIKDLDEDAKMRVIKYLIERFGIGTNPVSYTVMQPNHQATKAQITEGNYQTTHIVDAETIDYPTLKQLVIKNYPKNEPEWILSYAFFASKYGNETFKKEDVVEAYKECNRYTNSNKMNLSNNFNACIKKDWIKDINKDEFILKTEGVEYAKEVLSGNSTSKEVKRAKKNKPSNETN
ncbi:hypothetical protein [Flavobacterium sp. H122]|uniref:hypothetical protein n=1 Tax=Flavobacterium sp. H122 TaxID=2529860 RepID=UPI0010AA7B50|nr:hypothetical protein [Flavobacterium sp. H122]